MKEVFFQGFSAAALLKQALPAVVAAEVVVGGGLQTCGRPIAEVAEPDPSTVATRAHPLLLPLPRGRGVVHP